MTTLKGGVDGFIYFSLISVILFYYQDHTCIKSQKSLCIYMVVSTIHVFSFFLLYDLLFLNTLPTLLEKIMFCEKKLYDNRPFAHVHL